MAQRGSALFSATPRSLSGLAVIFLLFALLFAIMNGQRLKALSANASTPHALVPVKPSAPTNTTTGASHQTQAADTDRAAKAETALAQAEKEKADLKGKLDASQQEIAALRQ